MAFIMILSFPGCSEEDDPKCGDGVIDPELGEECDSPAFGGKRCLDLDFYRGTLGCFPPGHENECRFDTSACEGPECGNGTIEADQGEECDGPPTTVTCVTRGYDGGQLACFGPESESPCKYDESGCKMSPFCGDNHTDAGEGEECDGSDMSEQTCITLGFLGGTLSCNPTDCTFNTSLCTEPICGNNIKEGDEECDGTDLADQSCITLGFIEGELVCDNCSFDQSDCSGTPVCTNNIAEGLETCDGTDLRGQSCTTQGYLEGELGCMADCSAFDYTNCVGGGLCVMDQVVGLLQPNTPVVINGDLVSGADDDNSPSCGYDYTMPCADQVFGFTIDVAGTLTVDHNLSTTIIAMYGIGIYRATGGLCTDQELACEQTMQTPGSLTPLAVTPGAYYIITESLMATEPYTLTLTLQVP